MSGAPEPKRRRTNSPPPSPPPAVQRRDDSGDVGGRRGSTTTPSSSAVGGGRTAGIASASAPAGPAASSSALPRHQSFQLNRLRGAPPHHNLHTVGLADLLDGTFTECLLTNYKFDLEWLFAQCSRLREVPVTLVHGERDRAAMNRECRAHANITVVNPPLPIPYGTHHTKMMVVLYPTKVRVVICTANFIAVDWENKTQGIWYEDFGLRTLDDDDDDDDDVGSTRGPTIPALVDFRRDLIEYLACLGAPVRAFCAKLDIFDFSTAQVALVPSIPGVHTGPAMEKYGHLRVGKILQKYAAPRPDHPLICQFSSLGSLDEKWLFGEFAGSLMPGFQRSTDEALPIKSLHIVWPSVNDVRNSIEGWNAGRAIPCALKNMKSFLHKYLRKWSPPPALHRQNAMPHIKTFARFDPHHHDRVDWAILTSANLSKAAWGAYQKNRTQFMVRSYELGVLFLPRLLGREQDHLPIVTSSRSEDEPPAAMPLPYSFPLKTYDPARDEPWVWDIVREDPDTFGCCYIPH